jgi:hypothetical protein
MWICANTDSWIRRKIMTSKIIDGKRYDTEKATRITDCGAACSRTDFHWWKETLYRTADGRFFVEGTGNPMSHWARSNKSGSDEYNIRALTEEEARAWVERNANDQYSKIFPVEEG